jgi:arylsulfatase A-like enzyme
LVLVAALSQVVTPNALCADPKPRPNIVIIMVDDMGYEGVSCFGNPYFKTPEIDQLAAEGMRLTDFHSSGTVCSPTRAGLLTGRYQQRAGIEAVIHPVVTHPEHRKGLKESENTFAEILRQAGYTTGLIGKWHQGYPHNSAEYHPQNHGFDEFVGYHSGNIDFISHVGDHVKHDWWHGRKETHETGYSTHLINQYAVGFVERHRDKPFCLYIAHEAIHNPVQVPGDPVRRSEADGWKRWKPVNAAERIEKYKGMTLPIDEGVGQIRKKLVELGLDDNTFVLFFSDNGPARDFPSGSPKLRAGKGSVYEGGHRVPAIAWWPNRIEANTSSAAAAISIDVMPTVLSVAGVEPPDDRPLDGVDLSPIFFDQQPLDARPLFWASLSNGGRRSEAMRQGDWKLVVQHPQARPGTFEREKVELYRLDRDLGEKKDLAADQPQQTAAMLQQLKTWFAETTAKATSQPGGWIASQAKPRRIKPRNQQADLTRDVKRQIQTPFAANFALSEDDVVVFMGGTTVAKQDDFGYVETLLTLAAHPKRVFFRNMAWPADTVYRQQRPLNFGTQLEQLDRVGATIVVATFGQMEALDGLAKLPQFVTAYEALLDKVARRTRKIVLITPLPFASPNLSSLPDLTPHNPTIVVYATAIAELAKRRGYLCVDLSSFQTSGLTTDGLHLTAEGRWQVGFELSRQLLESPTLSAGDVNRDGLFTAAKVEMLRQSILEKNALWRRHWHPSNWSFAYGNRTHVPSSHDHRPGKARWFPNELDAIIPLIEQSEDQLLKLR